MHILQIPTSKAEITLTPELGTNYYFDSMSANCVAGQLKIAVLVFTADEFVEEARLVNNFVLFLRLAPFVEEPKGTFLL